MCIRDSTHRDPDSLRTQIEKAYYGKVLEKPIIEGPLFKSIYNEIFAINTTDTNILIDKLNKVFKSYFRIDRKKKDEELFDEMVKENKPKDFKSEEEMSSEYSDENIDEQFNIGSAEFTGSDIYFEDKKAVSYTHLTLPTTPYV